MSSHRRVKAVAYDDEGYDDDDYDEEEYGEEGEEEMSAQDKEMLKQGTLKVKESLPLGVSVPEQEIREALWHYYYDVSKTLSFLKNKYAPAKQKSPTQAKSPKAPKAASRFDQAVNAAASGTPKKQAGTSVMYPIVLSEPFHCGPPFSAAEFFKDTPWLDVPLHRRGDIIVEPLYPKGRLLGGSSKPSKLAALAAARKKKLQEQEQGAQSVAASSGADSKQKDRAVALLDRLSGAGVKPKNIGSAPSAKGLSSGQESDSLPVRAHPSENGKSPSPLPSGKEEKASRPSDGTEGTLQSFEVPDLQASPSIFAAAIMGRCREDLGTRKPLDSSMKYFKLNPPNDVAKFNPFAGPSPDDVVLNAQAQAKGLKAGNASKASKSEASAEAVTEDVASLVVEDAPRIKSKNLDVIQEFKKSNMKRAANFVVIGHVDHGKSTLMGRLLYDLKVVDQRSVDKLRKEAENIGKSSFALAWVMDQTTEERERGVTVDIATNNFETEKTRFTILDAPGHKDFIPNMIAGTSQADFAVLVIDASTNSFESGLRGQTKEHALLARSIGVQRLIVAVNKMDTVNWSQERFNEITQQMTAFLTAAGFQNKNLAFVPCAGLTGDNIVRPLAEGKAPWYGGRTLLEELDESEPAKRAIEKPLRMTVSDVFRGGITNPLSICGRLDSGSLQVGDAIVAMPSGERAVIKGIEADGEAADWAVAGQIVTLHLADIDPVHLRLGDIVCAADRPVRNARTFTAKILAFEHVMPMHVDVYRGRLNVSARVTKLLATLDKSSGDVVKKKPRIVQPGSVARVVVEMASAIPLEAGARVVLRAEGLTVAAGLLEKVE